ncbi:MAG: LacI family transcriptional regulator [Anaerolineae bacterium]|nr:LacI family transcriptional regulator [Anaerolineae bacterium]
MHAGFKRATIADVARRAGVSIASVSRVMNGTSGVSEETASQARAAIAELHYIPRAAARGLASRRTHTIGLLLPEISGYFFPPLLRGTEAGARENGYSLLFYSMQERSGPFKVHGHRRIAFLSGPPGHEDPYWRQAGYRESLQAHGIPFDLALMAEGRFYDEEEAAAAVENWLAAGTDMDAIFSGDDEVARGAIAALQRAGRRVPEDVAVVGFGDIFISRYLSLPLTTVRAPMERAGQVAVQQLVQWTQARQVEPLPPLPTELVIRRSCGCGMGRGPDPSPVESDGPPHSTDGCP